MNRLRYLIRNKRFRRFMLWWTVCSISLSFVVCFSLLPKYTNRVPKPLFQVLLTDMGFQRSIRQIERILIDLVDSKDIDSPYGNQWLPFSGWAYENFFIITSGLMAYFVMQKMLLKHFEFSVHKRWILIHFCVIVLIWVFAFLCGFMLLTNYETLQIEIDIGYKTITIRPILSCLNLIMFVVIGIVQSYLLKNLSRNVWVYFLAYLCIPVFVGWSNLLWSAGYISNLLSEIYYLTLMILTIIVSLIISLSVWLFSDSSMKKK